MSDAIPRWERILWKRQPYPDNHVDGSFLSQLQMNSALLLTGNVYLPSFGKIALMSLGIPQQFASVLLYVALFEHLRSGRLSSGGLVSWSVCVTLVTALVSSRAPGARKLLRSIPGLAVLVLALYALTPVLRTLTEATASDSIWALATVLFGGHLALADYTMTCSTQSPLQGTVSLNMAMCASVVLASRLCWDTDVFALLLLALQQFAIYPLLRDYIYAGYGQLSAEAGIPAAALPLTVVHICGAMYAMAPISPLVAYTVIPGVSLFISVLCPLWMRLAQSWKREMSGPWDEAVIVPGM